jgi:hypothetical protein
MKQDFHQIGSHNIRLSNIKDFGLAGSKEATEAWAAQRACRELSGLPWPGFGIGVSNIAKFVGAKATGLGAAMYYKKQLDYLKEKGKLPFYMYVTSFQGDNFEFHDSDLSGSSVMDEITKLKDILDRKPTIPEELLPKQA